MLLGHPELEAADELGEKSLGPNSAVTALRPHASEIQVKRHTHDIHTKEGITEISSSATNQVSQTKSHLFFFGVLPFLNSIIHLLKY